MIKATYIDHMGSDLSVVNAARVSFGKVSKWEEPFEDCDTSLLRLSERDEKLIRYLAKHNHISPFGHSFASFHVKAPIFVARQLVKHKFLRWNEISRRYVDDEPEFWWPDKWRGRSENKKQGSAGTVDLHEYECTGEVLPKSVWVMPLDESLSELSDMYKDQYKALIKAGVAPEMARMILPQNMYTEWHWSGSMLAWAHVCNLRCHPEAQQETRELCKYIDVSCENLWPVSWKALREGV